MVRGDKQIPGFVLKGGSAEYRFSCFDFPTYKVLSTPYSLKKISCGQAQVFNLIWGCPWFFEVTIQKERQAGRADFNCFASLLPLNDLHSWIWNVLASSLSELNLPLTRLCLFCIQQVLLLRWKLMETLSSQSFQQSMSLVPRHGRNLINTL